MRLCDLTRPDACDLTPEVVEEWVGILSAADGAGKRRLGPTSARLVRNVLSMALKEAVERGRLARNPVGLTQPPRRIDRARVERVAPVPR